jgi:hypothetical protein
MPQPPFINKIKMAVKKKEDGKSTGKEKEVVFEDTSAKEEVVVSDNDVTNEEAVMPVSAVEEMLRQQEERMSSKFSKMLQKFKLGAAKDELEEGAAYISELQDDWLDNPAVFFAYSFDFSIHGDKKRGVETKPPHGMIKFKPIVRSKRPGRKSETVISVSSVKVHSKAVADYLRNHSQFQIMFFESMEKVLNIDTDWAQRLIEANTAINNMSDQQVIARCRQYGITIGSDIKHMRKSLVEHEAERAASLRKEKLYGKLERATIETDRSGNQRVVEEK